MCEHGTHRSGTGSWKKLVLKEEAVEVVLEGSQEEVAGK